MCLIVGLVVVVEPTLDNLYPDKEEIRKEGLALRACLI